jgi:hypothetical protein
MINVKNITSAARHMIGLFIIFVFKSVSLIITIRSNILVQVIEI